MFDPPGHEPELPTIIDSYFATRGWTPYLHQLEHLYHVRTGKNAVIVAPTGAGKTLAGFLPTFFDFCRDDLQDHDRIHTLYISPLKALATDIARNLEEPVAAMGLDLRIETRSGDTPANRRQRQRLSPPQILLTTPESLALLLSYDDSSQMFAGLKRVIVDELHALADTKRGHLLALGLARLAAIAPDVTMTGLSATLADIDRLRNYVAPGGAAVEVVMGLEATVPEIDLMIIDSRMPWAGHSAVFAMPAVYQSLRDDEITLIFVNTRSQAERVFQELWRINDRGLRIALHHGSLDVTQRRKVEAAMADGRLDAIVATSSLDLGIDWGDVGRIIQIGGPKGVSRLLQRIGRSNHRVDTPSKATLVPANRFEVLECVAAQLAIEDGHIDRPTGFETGALDVLAQHILCVACSGTFKAEDLFDEVRGAAPYAGLSMEDWQSTLNYVADGGYCLRVYDQYKRLHFSSDGRYHLVNKRFAQRYRMNVGVIVEQPSLNVRMRRRRDRLGDIDESFINTLEPGDKFFFAGLVLRLDEVIGADVFVTSAAFDETVRVPIYGGGKFPISARLSEYVRMILGTPSLWTGLPEGVRSWLELQAVQSDLPSRERMLVETFERRGRHFFVLYGFEGQYAHQSLGLLLTKRMARNNFGPLGFLANDYAVAIWTTEPINNVADLLSLDILADDLEDWMAESTVLKRIFRNVATVSGLVQRRLPGAEKSGRQMSVSTDLLFDMLRRYESDHILLRATRQEAEVGLVDLARLKDLLFAIQSQLHHRHLNRVSPLALSLIVQIGRESVNGHDIDMLLAEISDDQYNDLDFIEKALP